MRRQIRRALRQWKTEFAAFWGRFTTFHRVSLAILLAIGMVYGSRRYTFDQRRAEIDTRRKELQRQNVPAHVPTPEEDEEVQQNLLRAEGLGESLAQFREEVAMAATARGQIGYTQALEAVAALDAAIARHGLAVRKRNRKESEEAGPLRHILHTYEVMGSFAGIHSFLHGLEAMPQLCRVADLHLAPAENQDGSPLLRGAQPQVILTFSFASYYAD